MSNIVILVWLFWMSLLDIKNKRVPMRLIVGGGILLITVSLVGTFTGSVRVTTGWSYVWMLLKGMIPGIGLLLLALVTKVVGSGDGMVLICLGAVLGLRESLLVLCVALFLAALGSVVLLVLRKVSRRSCLPFIPFMALGWILVAIS